MEQFDAAIIGFGTAGLALGGALADDGQNIVVVEQSDTMYGGACVNNACIPTKALVESARLTADEARKAGYSVQVYKLPAEKISQARILQDPVGLMKAVVDANSGVLLGMDLFCEDAQELVNTVKLVMDARIPASVLQSAVFTHPSMTEAFNNLFLPQNMQE